MFVVVLNDISYCLNVFHVFVLCFLIGFKWCFWFLKELCDGFWVLGMVG